MKPLLNRLEAAVHFIKKQIAAPPAKAIILGTGLKDLSKSFEIIEKIPLRDIPFFPPLTVDHMDDSLYLVREEAQTFWILGGRIHYYEGYSMEEVTFPIRLLALCGVDSFFITNAAGNVNPVFEAGQILLIRDHINWSFPSPLIGPNQKDWGARYPGMIQAYDQGLLNKILIFAKKERISLDTGVYLGLTGPQLETLAEYQMFHRLGADMVGMSTIPEVIVAAHMSRKVTALSILSNDATDPEKATDTDISQIIGHIRARHTDVLHLIRYWLSIT